MFKILLGYVLSPSHCERIQVLLDDHTSKYVKAISVLKDFGIIPNIWAEFPYPEQLLALPLFDLGL